VKIEGSAGAGGVRSNPGSHEVRKLGSGDGYGRPTGAGIPAMGHERIASHVNSECREIASPVAPRVLESVTKLRVPESLPRHRKRREPPVRSAGHAARQVVLGLMARCAAQPWNSLVFEPPADKVRVRVSIIALPRKAAGRVAVQASGMTQNLGDLVKREGSDGQVWRSRIRWGRCFGTHLGPGDEERGEGVSHAFSPRACPLARLMARRTRAGIGDDAEPWRSR